MWSFKKIVVGAMLMLGVLAWAEEYSPVLVMRASDKTWLYRNGKKPVSYTEDDAYSTNIHIGPYPQGTRLRLFDVVGTNASIAVPVSVIQDHPDIMLYWHCEFDNKTYILIPGNYIAAEIEELK